MRRCSLCKKTYYKGYGKLFRVPKDVDDRTRWSIICGINFAPSALICANHFLSSSIINLGSKSSLLPNAVPIVSQYDDVEISTNITEKNVNAARKDPRTIIYDNRREQFTQNVLLSKSNVIPSQLQQETVINSVFCTASTQTNTRLCGFVQISDFADEFRFNCFYCSKVFPLAKWKVFVNHLKKKHFEMEEAFKISEYISLDHDYTPICQPPFTSAETVIQTVVINAESLQPIFVEPLQPTRNPIIESVVLDPSFYCIPDENKIPSNTIDVMNKFIVNNTSTNAITVSGVKNKLGCFKKEPSISSLPHYFKNVKNKTRKLNKIATNSKSKVISSGVLYLKDSKWQFSKRTALSRCLKRTNIEATSEDKEYESSSMENMLQKPTEIAFEYTPRDIVDLLLDSMQKYPVLWQYDAEPFNEDFYEAVDDLCKIINDKWSLNIDNLKMRRSVNRILRFYCYLFPNANMENIDQFTNYYDKCAVFLPSSVNDIAYARCSHCYMCYRNDFDLKRHLLEEQKYLQWPYKCIQCKECFRESDEYEFHKRLPHYDEIFRCEPCNKTFVRRNIYNKHIAVYHPKEKRVEYKCDVCDRSYQSRTSLKNHKLIHGDRKYKCHLCPKSYFVNSGLKIHLKSHRKEYDYMCEVCGKEFLVQSNLRQHMKKHTGAKVTCNICNLKLRKSSLNRHLRLVHVAYEGTVESTFRAKCYHYNRFLRQRQLRPKKKGEGRKYHCKICKMSFENYKLVVEHNKELHSDIPKLPCKICGAEFGHKLNLKRHYRRKHNLHGLQVFKLVDENEDINVVLDMETQHLDKSTEIRIESKNKSERARKTPIVKAELLPGEMYFEEEKIHGSTIQDEIMNAADNITTQEIKLEFMNDFFTDLLKEHQKIL